jgi:hypothetical protein
VRTRSNSSVFSLGIGAASGSPANHWIKQLTGSNPNRVGGRHHRHAECSPKWLAAMAEALDDEFSGLPGGQR